MPSSSKPKRRDPRASRGASTRQTTGRAAPAGKRGPRKPRKSDDAETSAALSSEDAAELEALTAPLRRYRAQTGRSARTQGAEAASSTQSERRSAGDASSAEHVAVEPEGAATARKASRRDKAEQGREAEAAAGGGGRGRRAGGRFGERGEAEVAARGGARSRRRDEGRFGERGEAEVAAGGGGRGRRAAGRFGERRHSEIAAGGGRGRRDEGRFGERSAADVRGGGRGRQDEGRFGERSVAADVRGGGRRREGGRFGEEERRGGRELPRPARGSLAQKGGEISTRGDEAVAAQLAAALAAADSDETNDLTHGFHTYPARMHPRLARELIARFSEPEDLVLDPFCGSGTVLVEALVAGRKPQGVDLNPLALRISEMHCALRDARARRRFQRLLRQVADASEERVRSRARAHIPIDRDMQAFYQPHVLFELCGLREEIEAVPDEADRRALMIVFSSLLIKFSRKRADTSGDVVDKRIRKGLVTEFFERKGQELSMRWEALFDAAPEDAFPARLICGDARDLPQLLGARFQADLILTSPPYGGTYDYARQHQLRNAWFGFDTERLQEREIGARRALSRAPSGAARWNQELLEALRAMREVASDSGDIILWLGDAEISGQRIRADEQVAELAPRAALALKASAAQPRLDARGGPDRLEHLLLLEPQPFPQR